MDQDDDFFDVRSRFAVPEKRKKGDDDSGSSDSDSDSTLQSTPKKAKPSPRKPLLNNRLKKLNTPKSNRHKVVSLFSDEEDEDDDSKENGTKIPPRHKSLTPPPLIGKEELRKVRDVLANHALGSSRTRTGTRSTETTPRKSKEAKALDDSDDDFDLEAFQSAVNSDIAKQATQLAKQAKSTTQKASVQDTKIVIVLCGRRVKREEVPIDWEKPLGLKVTTGTAFFKIKDEFLKNRKYEGEIVLAWRGARLFHGTPKDIGMAAESRIDVYTEEGWKLYEADSKRAAHQAEVVSLSSEEEEEALVRLILQGPSGKVKFSVKPVATIRKLAAAYRQQGRVPLDKKIIIELDGEVLEDSVTVKESGLENDDLLDVSIEDL